MNLKSKLRSGTCELEEEMGRGRVQRVERLCRLCGIEVGSVSHFVVRCGPLESCRRRWWEELLCMVEKETGGKMVADNLQKWKGEGWHEEVTVLLLGGGGEINEEIKRTVDREIRKGIWRMMKERRILLEESRG